MPISGSPSLRSRPQLIDRTAQRGRDLRARLGVAMQTVDDPRQMTGIDPDLSCDLTLHPLRLKDRALQGGRLPHGTDSREASVGCQDVAQRIASVGVPKLIRDRLVELFDVKPELNPSVLSRMTVIPGEDIGIGEKTIQAIITNPGRVPEARTLEAIARALGENHEDYYEWPIAAARRDAAATPAAGRRRAADATRKAAQRRSARQTKPQEDPGENPGSGRAA